MDDAKPEDKPTPEPAKPIKVGRAGKPLAPPLPPVPESTPETQPEPQPPEPRQAKAMDGEPKRGPGRPAKVVAGPSELIPGHRARVARVHANQAAWLPMARWTTRAAESLGRVVVERRVLSQAQSPEHAARLQQAVRTFPTLEQIPVEWDGKVTTCAELEAQNVAVIAAYALPFTPDDPLFAVLLRHGAVTVAVEKALEKHLQAHNLIPTEKAEES